MRSPPLRIAALLAALLVFSLAFQGSRGLWEPDEGRYSDVALEMIALDNWLEPHLHFEDPLWTKPPLTYWAIAASLATFGQNELAVRLTSALSFFATAVLLGLLGQIFLSRQPWISAPLYAASILPFVASSLVTTDSLLALWECLAVYAFARASWHPGCRHHTAWLMVMWAAFGLAFMTKGPPGLLPLLAIVAFVLTTPRLRRSTGLKPWPGILLLFAVALPWYLLVIWRKPDLLAYFFGQEVVARVASDQFRGHGEWYGAFEIYLPTLLIGTLPWTWWWLRAGWRSIDSWRRQGRAALSAVDEKQRFLAWWILLPLAAFFVARSRMPLYVLPLAAPLVLLAAGELLKRPGFPTRPASWLFIAWMCLLVALRGASGWVESSRDARAVAESLHRNGIRNCEELAFYAMRPIRGLRFYMNCEIERVDDAELEDELAEREVRFWLTRPRYTAKLDERMRANGKRIELVTDDLPRLRVYRELNAPRRED